MLNKFQILDHFKLQIFGLQMFRQYSLCKYSRIKKKKQKPPKSDTVPVLSILDRDDNYYVKYISLRKLRLISENDTFIREYDI
jgi:hypothetical protein